MNIGKPITALLLALSLGLSGFSPAFAAEIPSQTGNREEVVTPEIPADTDQEEILPEGTDLEEADDENGSGTVQVSAEEDETPSSGNEDTADIPAEPTGDIPEVKGIRTIDTEEKSLVPGEAEGRSPEDMLGEYVNNAFSVRKYSLRKSALRSTGSRLTGVDAAIYSHIAGELDAIAAGQRASTVFEIPVEELGLGKTYWTAQELNVPSILALDENGDPILEDGYATFSDEAFNAAVAKTDYNLSLILSSLLADFPYQLYWYDKTMATQVSGISIGGWYEPSVDDFVIGVDGSYVFYFPVAEGMDAGSYQVDTSIGQSVQTSVENAHDIVDEFSDSTDYEKLCGYKEEICSLVSYNSAAAGGGVSYGNPWQLIWVFDDDPDTKVVCEGYAKAFKYLCDLSSFSDDVSCITVSGIMNGGTGAGNHMWNIVSMEDGKNYLVDVTNCDSETIGAPDQLFMSGFSSGSLSAGFVFNCTGAAVTYKYDSDTRELYTDEELTVCSLNYKPGIQITGQPANAVLSSGKTAQFHVSASGTGLTYQWQFSKDSGKTWTNSSSATAGYNTDTLQVQAIAVRNGYLYRCKVTDAADRMKISEPAKLTVNASLAITKQPSAVSAVKGSTAKFSVTATGNGLTYQWQFSNTGGSSWKNCSSTTTGYNTAVLQVQAIAARNGYMYRCAVTDAGGNKKTSNAAKLTVIEDFAITKQPSAVSALKGSLAKFSVTATGNGLTYQWQFSNTNGSSWKNCSSATTGYNAATLQVQAITARNSYLYRCMVTDGTGKKLTSSAAKLTVVEGFAITGQPSAVTAAKGSTAVFRVTAVGNGLTYQWQFSNTNGSSWKNCSSTTTGYNTAALQVQAIMARNGYLYRCIVTDGTGKRLTSSPAKLTVTN